MASVSTRMERRKKTLSSHQMTAYALFTMMLLQPTIPDTRIKIASIEWNPVPISIHETWRLCRFAEYDAAGFKRRLTETEMVRFSSIHRCRKVNLQ
jgi:hypothetical protein